MIKLTKRNLSVKETPYEDEAFYGPETDKWHQLIADLWRIAELDQAFIDGKKVAHAQRSKAGGEKEKIRMPILIALAEYFRDHPRTAGLSNRNIADRFLQELAHNEVFIDHNETEWRVYAIPDEGLVFAEPDKQSIHVISVKLETLRKNYIPKVKLLGI